MRWLSVAFAAWLALCGCVAAQSPIASFPPGTFQNRAAIDVASGQPMVTPIFVDTTIAVPSNSATNYIGVNGGTWNATQTNRETIFPVTGAMTKLSVRFPTSVASGSYDICLVKNSSATCTALTCTIDNANPTCTSTSSAAITAGDLTAWKVVPTGTPTAQVGNVQISAAFTSTANGESFLVTGYGANNPNTGSASYAIVGSKMVVPWNAADGAVSGVMPTDGVVDQLWASTSGTAPGAAKSIKLELVKNGSTQALTCTMTGTGSGNNVTFCSDQDTGHAVTYAAGDTISVLGTPTGTPAVGFFTYGVRFVPTVPGEAAMISATGIGSAGSIRYINPQGGENSATEASVYRLAPVNFTWKKLYVSMDTAPTPGNWTVINRVGNGTQSDGTMTCNVPTGGATTCNDTTHTYAATAGDFINWKETPASTPVLPTTFKFSSVMATQ